MIKFRITVLLLIVFILNSSAQHKRENTRANERAGYLKIFRKDIVWFAAAGLYAGTGVLVYRNVDMKVREDVLVMNSPLIRKIAYDVSPFGLGRNQWIGCGTTAALSFISGNKKLQKTAVIWAGSLIISDLITTNLKNTVQRHRPNTGSDSDVFDGKTGLRKNQSFPSAHTSNAFATATAIATVYRKNPAVVVLAYGMATVIGTSRIINNAHWTSDVMAGAAVGFLSARTMNYLYRKAEKKIIIATPQIGRKYSGLSITVKL